MNWHVGAQYVRRLADAEPAEIAPAPNDAYIHNCHRTFDVTDKVGAGYSLGVDVEPMETLALGVEYQYWHNNYDRTVLGRKWDRTNALYANISSQLPNNIAHVAVFGSLEKTESVSSHRNYPN